MLRYTTDRARPGLVALYDIRPGNGAGQFLQPRSPHGAVLELITKHFAQIISVRTQFVPQWRSLLERTPIFVYRRKKEMQGGGAHFPFKGL